MIIIDNFKRRFEWCGKLGFNVVHETPVVLSSIGQVDTP